MRSDLSRDLRLSGETYEILRDLRFGTQIPTASGGPRYSPRKFGAATRENTVGRYFCENQHLSGFITERDEGMSNGRADIQAAKINKINK